MAMLVNSLVIDDYNIHLLKCFVRVDSIYWHKNNPLNLIVLVHIWKDEETSKTANPFSKSYALDISKHTNLFKSLQAAIYKDLKKIKPDFEDSTEI